MLKAALAYAAHGFPVFPCNPTANKAQGSKAPLVAGESRPAAKDGGHWLASCEAGQITRWWSRWPQALIGFPTGARTGTVVIDLDPREAALADMLGALNTWCGGGLSFVDPQTGEIIPPAFAQTQSGGLHIYFSCPEQSLKNRANLFGHFITSKEAPPALAHVDVRAEGGYVIAPPSVMESGASYSFVRKPQRKPNGQWHLPPLPRALLRVITRERLPHAAVPAFKPVPFKGEAGLQRYLDKSFDGILRTLQSAGKGERNQMIFWAAARLGEFVRGGVLPPAQATAMLLSHLPQDVSAAEPKALKTIQNGLRDCSTPAFSPTLIQNRRASC